MSPIALYIADGTAFIVAMLLVAAMVGVAFFPIQERRPVRILHSLLFLTGLVLGVVSGMPLPYWLLALWFIIAIAGAVAMWRKPQGRKPRRIRAACMGAAMAASLIVCTAALVQRRLPPIELTPVRTIYVIGDSISAGLAEGETLWPALLAEASGQRVVNLARAGATMSEATRQAREIEERGALVLVELGGNDILSFVPPSEFSRATEALLRALSEQGHDVVMFEIPLPPFGHPYGIAQRHWANEYGAKIIPRHVLAGVFRLRGSTSDGLHLSQAGHRALAEKVAGMMAMNRNVEPALPESSFQQETKIFDTLSLPLESPRLVVLKSERRALLYDGEHLVRTYSIALGDDPVGTKTRKGDEKTPEGRYYICTRLEQSRFHLFMGINYPNAADASAARERGRIAQSKASSFIKDEENRKCPDWTTPMGGAIGLHGGGTTRDWTDGCIAFSNKDIEEIWAATRYWTPVDIRP